ncbi:MAG: hypothetical protein WAW73_09965 [Rhodoferax sp.]
MTQSTWQWRVPLWLKRLLGVFLGLYILLGTYAWNLIYGLIQIAIYPTLTVRELAEHPSCIPGDWVLETFQPMISDARMIEHWQKHRADMALTAEMIVKRQHADNNGLTKEARALYSKISVEVGEGHGWSLEPYSIESAKAVDACYSKPRPQNESQEDRLARVAECSKTHIPTILLKPTFGKTHQDYFCTTRRHSSKQYIYFPGPEPHIVDGYLMGPIWGDGRTGWKEKVVPNTDRFDSKECTVRQLDPHWFIGHC